MMASDAFRHGRTLEQPGQRVGQNTSRIRTKRRIHPLRKIRLRLTASVGLTPTPLARLLLCVTVRAYVYQNLFRTFLLD